MDRPLQLVALITALCCGTAFGQATIHVDDTAAGANDGSTWCDAYVYLQDALSVAASGDTIRIAEGVYQPDRGGGNTRRDRYATFALAAGVTIEGGYAGCGAVEPSARDITLFETILSGDLNQNDVGAHDDDSRNDNCYQVLTGNAADASTLMDGLTITGGTGIWGHGGGLSNNGGSPTLVRCTFERNSDLGEGGAVYNESGASPTFISCTFRDNWAGSPSSGSYALGGAVCNYSASASFINCVFSGNLVEGDGAAVYNSNSSHVTLINCTFVGNTSSNYGGGVYSSSSSNATITNSLLWGNRDRQGTGESAQIRGPANVSHSCIQGLANLSGNGNIGDDPLFYDALGPDTVPGTADDNLRLRRTSPAIDAADNNSVPVDSYDLDLDQDIDEPIPIDVEGKARLIDAPDAPDTGIGVPPLVDMGAYEGPELGLQLSVNSIEVPEGGSVSFSVRISANPLETVYVFVQIESGDADISVESGAELVFDSTDYHLPQLVSLHGALDTDFLEGEAVVTVTCTGLATEWIIAYESEADPVPPVIFVAPGAQGTGNGATWADAFTDIQSAIATAQAVENYPDIWVSRGEYRPAHLTDPDNQRSATFLLPENIRLFGSFAGTEDPATFDVDDRDFAANASIVTGDLNDDDLADDDLSRRENAYHIVTNVGTSDSTRLDGFVLTHGNADWHGGAGIQNDDARLTVANCRFVDNWARDGHGAAISAWRSHTTVISCNFSQNSAGRGGAIYNRDSYIDIINSAFDGNVVPTYGGAVYNDRASARIANTRFRSNHADYMGGAILTVDSASLSLTNCSFVRNTGESGGALAASWNTTLAITNCTFLDNDATEGAAIRVTSGSSALIANTILWDGDDEIVAEDSTIEIVYSTIYGGWPGVGNSELDPQIVDPDADNLHLATGSPCIDAGDNAAVPLDEVDLDGDGDTNEPIPFDLESLPRFVDDPTATPDPGSGTPPVVDMGAFEYQPDCNENGVIDSLDLEDGTASDCDANGVPDECDRDCNANTIPDACDIASQDSQDCDGDAIPDECQPDCNANGVADVCDIASGLSADCTGDTVPDECEPDCNSNGLPDSCDIAELVSEDCNHNGVPDACDIQSGDSTDEDGNGFPDECAILLVDHNATGPTHDGLTWCGAFLDLQDALAVATYGYEIRVAGGTYRPDRGTGERTASFGLSNGLRVYGGFAGCGAEDPNARDRAAYPTILSGDLQNNDQWSWMLPSCCASHSAAGCEDSECAQAVCDMLYAGPTCCDDAWTEDCAQWARLLCGSVCRPWCGDNSHHVVVAESAYAETILDGFLIEGGCAEEPDVTKGGGGFYAWASSVRVSNCTFRDNVAEWGGGAIKVTGGSPVLSECAFEDNSAWDGGALSTGGGVVSGCSFTNNEASDGGAVYASSGAFVGCAFSSNRATRAGGAMVLSGGIPSLVDCRFEGNVCSEPDGTCEGGAVQTRYYSNAVFSKCTFIGNTSDYGGAVYERGVVFSTVPGGSYANCAFLGNTATQVGGAIRHYYVRSTLANCVVSGNTAPLGGGLAPMWSTVSIRNSTVYQNVAGSEGGGIADYFGWSTIDIENSIVWGNTAGSSAPGSFDGNLLATGCNPPEEPCPWEGGINFSCIEGLGDLGSNGEGNTSADPVFLGPAGSDGRVGTADDDFRLLPASPCIDAGSNSRTSDDFADLDRDEDILEPIPFDFFGRERFVDDPAVADVGEGPPPVVDMGAVEFDVDCNDNGILDREEIGSGAASDCNGNMFPDDCEPDCNGTGAPDDCDIAGGTSQDCDENGIPDECTNSEDDCNGNGVPDMCDLQDSVSEDCDGSGIPDECEPDYDDDGIIDPCDDDWDGDGVPNDEDICVTPIGSPVQPNGAPIFDTDYDCWIDRSDVNRFLRCFRAEGPEGCEALFDYDGDGDVDLFDFAELQTAFEDPNF